MSVDAARIAFLTINYGLAVVVWSCVGRFLLSFFVPAIQPSNYIWRAFSILTEWAVRLSDWITPSFMPRLLMPLVAAFWVYATRIVLLLVLLWTGALDQVPTQ